MKLNVQINAPLFPSSRRVDDSSRGAIILLWLNPVSLRQRDVLRPRVHDRLLRGTVSCVSTSARKTYRSLIARTTAHPARGSHRLMAYSRRVNANILLANSLRPHLSRGLGHLYLVHARQCDISRTNQRRIPISLSFAEYHQLSFSFRQWREFTTQFPRLSF